MPLTSAEKQRRYRHKRDQNLEKRDDYLQKGRARWLQYKTSGKVKSISERSERDQRAQRKDWKQSKRASRSRKKNGLPTPPASPAEDIPQPEIQLRYYQLYEIKLTW